MLFRTEKSPGNLYFQKSCRATNNLRTSASCRACGVESARIKRSVHCTIAAPRSSPHSIALSNDLIEFLINGHASVWELNSLRITRGDGVLVGARVVHLLVRDRLALRRIARAHAWDAPEWGHVWIRPGLGLMQSTLDAAINWRPIIQTLSKNKIRVSFKASWSLARDWSRNSANPPKRK